jgi:hypothetical protein
MQNVQGKRKLSKVITKGSISVYIRRAIQLPIDQEGIGVKEKVCKVVANRAHLALARHESREALFRLTIKSQRIRRQVLRQR